MSERAPGRASEEVAREIQRRIQRERLEPGDFLGREEELAADFGVSRPTLREALRLLGGARLVSAQRGPGGGIFIARTAEQGIDRSLSDTIALMLETESVTLDELLEARVMLEVPMAGAAAYLADDDTLEEIRAAIAFAESAAPDDLAALGEADARVHRALAAVGNRVVRALTGWMLEVLQPALAEAVGDAVVPAAVVSHHRALLRALERGDAAAAERAMRDHLEYMRDVLRLAEGG